MKVLTRSALVMGVLISAFLLAVGRFPIGDGMPAKRTHKIPVTRRGTITLTLKWDPDTVVQSLTIHIGAHEETYIHNSLKALAGVFSRSYPYESGMFYAITGSQNNHDAGFTECTIKVTNSIIDAERLESGAGTVYCWAK